LGLTTSEDELLLLHNPKCSKSRATLLLLEERGANFRTRLYLEEPLGKEELVDLGRRLGRRAYEYTRRKESEFGDAGLDASSSEDSILDAVVAAPILMERPILIRGRRAVIGRPPEDVLSLLGD
jgi:arsenate reductase